jgi:hypothetical protein
VTQNIKNPKKIILLQIFQQEQLNEIRKQKAYN